MAGDLPISERVVFDQAEPQIALAPSAAAPVIHRYGRIGIVAETGAAAASVPGQRAAAADRDDLTEVERLGLAALDLRESAAYREAKQNRPRQGEQWDMGNCTTVVDVPPQV